MCIRPLLEIAIKSHNPKKKYMSFVQFKSRVSGLVGKMLVFHLWGLQFKPETLCGKVGSCLPMSGTLPWGNLTNCMYWFPLPTKLPVVIWPVQCLFIYYYYVTFNSQDHIVLGSLRVEEPVHTSWSRFCAVNNWAMTSNYQLSNMTRTGQDSNRQPQRLKVDTLTATPPSPLLYFVESDVKPPSKYRHWAPLPLNVFVI